jgi:hypothetical protein
MNRVGRVGLVAAVAAALESGLSLRALAQGTAAPGPAAEPGGAGTLIAVAIIGVLVVGLAVMVKMIDARRRREDKIAGVQGRLSDALAADAMFARLPVTVTVYGPGWGSGPATIVISGRVPNEEVREAARRVVEAEAQGRLEDFRIVDRMAIDQMAWERAA